MEYQIDLRQYHCPLPLFMVQKAMEQLESKAILCVILNHTSAVQDFKVLCDRKDYRWISCQKLTALGWQIKLQKP
ncbi:sulfurtransferase TusA family protein [Pasteurellaceae bacterium 22721_9_1]